MPQTPYVSAAGTFLGPKFMSPDELCLGPGSKSGMHGPVVSSL